MYILVGEPANDAEFGIRIDFFHNDIQIHLIFFFLSTCYVGLKCDRQACKH